MIYFPTDLLAQMFSSDFSNHHCHIRFALLILPALPRTLNDDLHTVLCHFSGPPPVCVSNKVYNDNVNDADARANQTDEKLLFLYDYQDF